MEKTVNITKNTSYLTLALILQKLLSFTYFTLLARDLGPENLGKYYFAISFTTVFSIFIDIGMINLLTREVAKRKTSSSELLGSVLAVKLPLVILTAAITMIATKIGGYDPLLAKLIYISLACVILDSFTTTFWAVARGFHNLIFESISSVIFMMIVMSAGLFFLYNGYGLIYLMSALLMASTFHFLYSAIVLLKKFKVSILPVFNGGLMKKMLMTTIPFGLFAVFQRLYTYLDSVLLGTLAGNEYVGYYQISFKIIFALQFLPMAFVASLYPAMSEYWHSNREQLKTTFEKALIYLMVISIPISAGVIALADKIILVFKEGYEPAILPMQIIILSVFFIFINFPIGSLLNACDRQKRNTANMIITTIASILLNIILIPRFQALGASITVLATNIFMSSLGIFWVFKIIKFDVRRVFLAFLKILLAAIVMALLVYWTKGYLNTIISILLGAFSYFLFLLLLKTIKKDEVRHICGSFLKK
ncbi:oligosaccharide flippase family protein [Candidatus Falkowbacteria bacterium]|nr:oligosaccharide flippase family protein [Candidatus Falkowbacteria bacterium]